MGRKIEMKRIENTTRRQITFSKRKTSLLRKGQEISILCDVDIALLTYSPSGRVNKFCSKDKMEDLIQTYIDLPPDRRYHHVKNLEAKLEKLQMLDFIGNDDNKLEYLNDRIKHLELKEQTNKKKLVVLEARLKEYDITWGKDAAKEPCMDQVLLCEKNLDTSLQAVMARKSELVKESVELADRESDHGHKTQEAEEAKLEMENKKGEQQQQLDNNIEKMSGTAGTNCSSKDTEDKNKGRMNEWKASTCINGQFNVGESCKFNEHLGGSTSIPVPKQLVNEDTMKKCMGQFHELGAVPSIHPLFNLSINNKVEEDAIFKGSNYHQMNPLLGAPSASIPFLDLSKVDEDIFIKPPMNQLLGPSSSILPQPHIDPSFALQFNSGKVSESTFQDIMDGSMSQLKAPAPPYTISSKVGDGIFQDQDAFMDHLGAPPPMPSSFHLLHRIANSPAPSMYHLVTSSSAAPPLKIPLPHPPIQTMMQNQYFVPKPQNQPVGILHNSSMGQFDHDPYGILQQYSTSTFGYYENDPDMQDGIISACQFNMSNFYPFHNSSFGIPSTSERVGSSVVFDPFFTTKTTAVKLNNENINSGANDEKFRDEVDANIKYISNIGNVKHPGKSDYEGYEGAGANEDG